MKEQPTELKARPSSTMARSQAGALECKAGLSLNVSWRKPVIRRSLPREEPPTGDRKADMAATYTFKVEGDNPAEKCLVGNRELNQPGS